MQKEKIDDLEIDFKELKYLLEGLDEEPMLARAAKRLIDLMKERLDSIKNELARPVKAEALLIKAETTVEVALYIEEENLAKERVVIIEDQAKDKTLENTAIPIHVLGEQLRPALELSKGLSLNDAFRFSRELFDDDNGKMNKVLQEISVMNSLADVLVFLSSHLKWDEENDATKDFIELLKKYFV